MYKDLIRFVRDIYGTNGSIPLHAPSFYGNEKKYVLNAIESTFVSSVGEYVNNFEHKVAEYTGVKYAIATVNGTAALQICLKLVDVAQDTEVITQSLTFVATCNAISYCGGDPIFVDVNRSTLGLSPLALKEFLEQQCEIRDDGNCWNKISNRKIVACLPMHTLGMPVKIDAIKEVCDRYRIALVEDAAESLGSLYMKKHTGCVGKLAALSFNGNKIISTGGGGMILTNDKDLAARAKHITTTAKLPHQWAFEHDQIGYNYRMPNLNAALGVAQMESLPEFVVNKRNLALQYQLWGKEHDIEFVKEPENAHSNYWLNSVITSDKNQRDRMLEETNQSNVLTRPAWTPMHKLEMYRNCKMGELKNTEWIFDRLVKVPSSVVVHE